MGYFVKNRSQGISPVGTKIPDGSTADRPTGGMALAGIMRYNSDDNGLEYFNGTSWNSLVVPGAVTIDVDKFLGNDNDTDFVLSYPAGDEDQILVFVGGVFQEAITSYTVSGTAITFSIAPPNNVVVSVVHNIGKIA